MEFPLQSRVFLCPRGLAPQTTQAGLDLSDDVIEPLEIGPSLFQAQQRIITTLAIGCDPGSLFEQRQPLLGSQG